MKRIITYAMYSDIGNRTVNEDAIGCFYKQSKNCFVLCDGLGGHGKGEKASSLVVSVFEKMFNETDNVSSFLPVAFSTAQEELLAEQRLTSSQHKMKTTAVALVTDDKNAYIGHIGDSRAYIFSKNRIRVRTLDHSVPQMLALSGEIGDRDIRHHPDRSSLLRVLGVEWSEPKFELMRSIPLRKCQAFLLCSDGFWEYIEDAAMCDLLKTAVSAEDWLNKMVTVVKQNSIGENVDNNSAIAVWCK